MGKNMDQKQQNQQQSQQRYQSQQHHQSQQQPNDQQHMLQQECNEDRMKSMNRGICYMSTIPPYMKPNYIRKLLKEYDVERIYLIPQTQWERKKRIKMGGNKKICFKEGWIEFSDKKIARRVANILNGQKMVRKKSSFYFEDVWTLKYLPKFKWHHLTERLAHQERLKRQRLKVQLDQQRKVGQFYSQQIQKSKIINGIVKNKQNKNKLLGVKNRTYQQKNIIQEQPQ